MRYENQVLPLNEGTQGREQLGVKRFEMALRGAKERLFESPNVVVAHAKLRELKAQQLQKMIYARKYGHRQDPDLVSCNYGRDKLIFNGEILDKRCVSRKACLQLCQGKIRRRFQRCVFPLVRREFPECAEQLLFLRLNFLVEALQAPAGFFFRTKLF